MVEYAVVAVFVAFVVALIFGAVTGRVRLSGCCTPADPRRDLRMRAAFEDEDDVAR